MFSIEGNAATGYTDIYGGTYHSNNCLDLNSNPGLEVGAFRSTFVPGVNLPCAGNLLSSDSTPGDPLASIGVPSGLFVAEGGSEIFMWYSWSRDLLPYLVEGSYLAYSEDGGLSWTAMTNGTGAIPFSQAHDDEDVKTRFKNVQAIEVDAADYQTAASAPCYLPEASGKGILLFATGKPYRLSDVYLAYLPLTALENLVTSGGQYNVLDDIYYFAGPDGGTLGSNNPGDKACWSSNEVDAKPILKTTDNAMFAEVEAACSPAEEVLSGGAGEISVKHITVPLTSGEFDRLVLLFNREYLIGGLSDPGNLQHGMLGPNLATGDPLRPWIWNTKTAFSGVEGEEIQPGNRPFKPIFVPAPPLGQDDVMGPGPVCGTVAAQYVDDNYLHGYGPYIIDRFTRVSDDGHGVNIYFPLSRWKGGTDFAGLSAGPYRVDVFRTTIYPTSYSIPGLYRFPLLFLWTIEYPWDKLEWPMNPFWRDKQGVITRSHTNAYDVPGVADGKEELTVLQNHQDRATTVYVSMCARTGDGVLAVLDERGKTTSVVNRTRSGGCEQTRIRLAARETKHVVVDTVGNRDAALGEYELFMMRADFGF